MSWGERTALKLRGEVRKENSNFAFGGVTATCPIKNTQKKKDLKKKKKAILYTIPIILKIYTLTSLDI